MARQVLLNYAVSFTEITAQAQQSTSYLRKVAIVCIGKDTENTITQECYDMDEVAALTDNTNAEALFYGGLSSVFVMALSADDATTLDIQAQINTYEYQFFTLIYSNDFNDSLVLASSNFFLGVQSAEFDSQVDAKTWATIQDHCGGLSIAGENKTDGICYAFGKLLSNRVSWKNQQYIEYLGNPIYSASSVGEASSYFDDRITFYTFDDDRGTCLSFFAAGGEPITYPYLSEELKINVQSKALRFMSTNQPYNTTVQRADLQNSLQAIVDGYQDDGYLNDEFDNQITITKSNDRYWVNGKMELDYSDPFWRIAIEAKQV